MLLFLCCNKNEIDEEITFFINWNIIFVNKTSVPNCWIKETTWRGKTLKNYNTTYVGNTSQNPEEIIFDDSAVVCFIWKLEYLNHAEINIQLNYDL